MFGDLGGIVGVDAGHIADQAVSGGEISHFVRSDAVLQLIAQMAKSYLPNLRMRTPAPAKISSCMSACTRSLKGMRNRDEVDTELRLLVVVRQSICEQGGDPSRRQIDELLCEWGAAEGG